MKENNKFKITTHGPLDPELLSRSIGYKFKDPKLLITALTHRSFACKEFAQQEYGPNNQRLEFLGDAVLSLVTGNYLYNENKLFSEGDLSRLRAQFVCQENLCLGAKRLDLGCYIYSERALRASGTSSRAVLADTLEAIFGAVFLDGGLASAQEVIFQVLGKPATKLANKNKDAKTKLQEIVQANLQDAPRYVVMGTEGPDHSPTFLVGVKICDQIVAKATGDTKKNAAQNAATLALKKIELKPSSGC